MKTTEEMQIYYGKRAGVYDASMQYDDPQTVLLLAPVINLLKRILNGRSVLEIACGPCFWTSQVSPAVLSIVATDCNESVLEMARCKPLDWDKITLQAADAYQLPLFHKRFDACMAVDWFSHVPQSRFHEFLRGVHSKLVSNAVVVFCDQMPGPQSVTELRDEEGNHLQERKLSDGSVYRVIKHFLTDDEFKSVLAPYTSEVMIERFPECRRVVVSYPADATDAA